MTRNRRLFLALGLALVLGLLAAGPVPWTEAASGIEIVGCQVSGNTVFVTLHNSGSAPSSGVVVVEAVVGGLAVSSVAPFAVGAGDSQTVGVVFTGTVQGVIRVGIVDGPDPV